MQRLKYLDGLKGIGCLMIFMAHVKMFGFSHPYEIVSVFNEIFYGDMFVNIFMLASAFGITASINSNLKKGNSLRGVILKRYLRLAIPIGIILLITAFIHYGGLKWNMEAYSLSENEMLTKYYGAVTLSGLIKAIFLSPFGMHYGWMSPAWMLKYIFYGTFACIALVLGTEGMKKWKIYAVCLFFIFLFYYVDGRMMFIFLGFMLYEYLKDKKSNKYDLWIALLFFSLYLALRGATFYFHFHRHGNISYSLAVFLTITVVHSSWIQKILSTKPILWLGKVSMSVYLLHFIFLLSFSSWIYVLLYDLLSPFMLSVVNLFISTIVLLLLSWLSQKYLEEKIAAPLTQKIVHFLEN